jgi:hypothetical protein
VLLFDPDAEHVAEVIRCGSYWHCVAAAVPVTLAPRPFLRSLGLGALPYQTAPLQNIRN